MAQFDLAIVGAGLTGALATAMAARRYPDAAIAWVAPRPERADRRTTAMLLPALADLDELGVWDSLRGHCAALRTMRLLDASTRLLRAPAVRFDASELGLDAFGWNVPNETALRTLQEAMPGSVQRIAEAVCAAAVRADAITLDLKDRTIEARFVFAADGRNSVLREAAGIAVDRWSYPQSALVTTFAHTQPHDGISTEFHTDHGPMTQVPLPGRDGSSHRSSLVWMGRPSTTDELAALDEAQLARRIEDGMQSLLGTVSVDGATQRFAMEGLTARHAARGPVLLLGEALHVFPPIGAQGFNLAHRDVVDAVASLQGGGDVAARYERTRRADVGLRVRGVDLLNRSLLRGYLPLHLGRVAGLGLLAQSAGLRRLAMMGGLGIGSGIRGMGPRAASPT